MAIKRSTAYRIKLKNIINSDYEKREGFNPSVIKYNNLEISRVNIIASVVGKYLTDDQNYCAITLDDGSETIRIKNFGAEVNIIKNVDIGDIVRVIGKIKEYNDEKYIVGELVKKINPNWLIVNELQLTSNSENNNSKINESSNEINSIKVEENTDEEEIISISSSEENSSINIKQEILNYIKNNDSGSGVMMDIVTSTIKEENDKIKDALFELLKVGEIYEPKKGILKILD
ncbi:MAG: OB-fold nucleic acid binding domain-containing protein [Candidatus Woesearchaeota archaeon]